MRRFTSYANHKCRLECGNVSSGRRCEGVATDLQKHRSAAGLNEEHRKSNRNRLALPMIFRWQDARQGRHEGVGLTRDLGIKGAFVMTRTPPPLQAKIKLTAYIPLVDGVGICMRLDGEGGVVRVEAVKHRAARRGFAVAGKRFIVRRSEM